MTDILTNILHLQIKAMFPDNENIIELVKANTIEVNRGLKQITRYSPQMRVAIETYQLILELHSNDRHNYLTAS